MSAQDADAVGGAYAQAVAVAVGREPDTIDWTPAGRAWWADTVARLAVDRCSHVARPGQPVTGATWLPTGLRCPECTDYDSWRTGDVAPPCGRCGGDVVGPESFGGFLQRGRVVLAVVLCAGCAPEVGAMS